MKNFIKAFRLTVVMCVLLGVGYVFVLWVFGKVAGPGNGNAEVVTLNGKVVGAANVGQQFSSDIYFWGRPSCAGDGYDAANSCGSNKGPTNPEYLAEVEARIDTFLVHHPYLVTCQERFRCRSLSRLLPHRLMTMYISLQV